MRLCDGGLTIVAALQLLYLFTVQVLNCEYVQWWHHIVVIPGRFGTFNW